LIHEARSCVVGPENRHSCVRSESTSRLREPVTGRQERPNSSTRSHDPITDIWKEIRHDYLEETSGCACLGARRDRASIAKLRAGSRPRHQRERSYDSIGATPTGAVGKPDSGPALSSRAGTHHQRAVVTARVPGPNRNRAMTPAGRADHPTPIELHPRQPVMLGPAMRSCRKPPKLPPRFPVGAAITHATNLFGD